MATKEVMVSAPVLVLLYDRAFVSGSFRGALRARWKFYAALAATWLVLAACLLGSGVRGGSAGYGSIVMWWMYAITQCRAILIYLKLVFWPSPLVFDYGVFFYGAPLLVRSHIIMTALLVAAAAVAMFRFPRAGIFGALFFAVLAPTSSVLPVLTQVMAEHRMYLPSAAVIAGVVVACWWLARKAVARRRRGMGSGLNGARTRSDACAGSGGLQAAGRGATRLAIERHSDAQRHKGRDFVASGGLETAPPCAGVLSTTNALVVAPFGWLTALAACAACAVAVAFGALTWRRNLVYRSAVSIWMDTAKKAPRNYRAHNNAGYALMVAKRYEEALPYCEEALRLRPEYGSAAYNAGSILVAQKRYGEAIEAFQKAISYMGTTDDARLLDVAYFQMGMAMRAAGRDEEGRAALEKSVALNPKNAPSLNNLGNYELFAGHYEGAVEFYERALAVDPRLAEAHDGLGDALAALGRDAGAREHYEEAIRLKPGSSSARYGYAQLLKRLGETEPARAQAREALRLRPDYTEAAEFLKTLPCAVENQEGK